MRNITSVVSHLTSNLTLGDNNRAAIDWRYVHAIRAKVADLSYTSDERMSPHRFNVIRSGRCGASLQLPFSRSRSSARWSSSSIILLFILVTLFNSIQLSLCQTKLVTLNQHKSSSIVSTQPKSLQSHRHIGPQAAAYSSSSASGRFNPFEFDLLFKLCQERVTGP